MVGIIHLAWIHNELFKVAAALGFKPLFIQITAAPWGTMLVEPRQTDGCQPLSSTMENNEYAGASLNMIVTL